MAFNSFHHLAHLMLVPLIDLLVKDLKIPCKVFSVCVNTFLSQLNLFAFVQYSPMNVESQMIYSLQVDLHS